MLSSTLSADTLSFSRLGWASISLIAIVAGVLLNAVFQALRDPLRHIPGPFWARYTKLWQFWQYSKGDYEETALKLHGKYGPVFRIAPGEYSIDDPQSIKLIYGHGSAFAKSHWYYGFNLPDRSVLNMFAEEDPKEHAAGRRKFASAYSMTSLVSYEPYVDNCTSIFARHLMNHAATGDFFDLGHYFQCYALDVIGEITFSERFGYLDEFRDIAGMMRNIDEVMKYGTLIGIFPSLHPFFFAMIQRFASNGNAGIPYIVTFTNMHIQKRRALRDKDGPPDFLTKFLKAQRDHPNTISDSDVIGTAAGNVTAGSDTTAISLCAIMYYLLKNPETMGKLQEELDEATAAGTASDPVTFAEAQKLPYLQAVIKEALRLHPAVGLGLARVVPKGGANILGHYFPQRTVVAHNAWVSHKNREVFGRDAAKFRPERWLQSKEESDRLDRHIFTFGQGSRTCIGKNISLLEMSKMIPQILRKFDFELENRAEWKKRSFWFVKPVAFRCRVALRKRR